MKSIYLFLTLLLLLGSSCKKEEGEGGTSHIKGKIYAKYYNKNFSVLADSGYAADIDVYIIYGDNSTFGERQRSTYDGTYEFKYLEKGSYRIYAYTKDSSGAWKNQVNQYAPDYAIIKEVEITKRKETVEAPEIQIVQ